MKKIFNFLLFLGLCFLNKMARAGDFMPNQELLDNDLKQTIYIGIFAVVITVFLVFLFRWLRKYKTFKKLFYFFIALIILGDIYALFYISNLYMLSYLRSSTNEQVINLFSNRFNPKLPTILSGNVLTDVILLQRDKEVIESVIKQGVDVNKKSRFYEKTPLMYAVISSSPDVVDLLIKNGADVNSKDNKDATPLMYSFLNIEEKQNQIIAILLETGVDVNASAKNKGIPLILAVNNDHINIETIKLFLEKGADPFQKNSKGISAYDMAKKKGKTDLTELFETYRKISN
ncbi:MAG: ankyrin repeat domain-containing protein [Alphaproteobacteria bacterium]